MHTLPVIICVSKSRVCTRESRASGVASTRSTAPDVYASARSSCGPTVRCWSWMSPRACRASRDDLGGAVFGRAPRGAPGRFVNPPRRECRAPPPNYRDADDIGCPRSQAGTADSVATRNRDDGPPCSPRLPRQSASRSCTNLHSTECPRARNSAGMQSAGLQSCPLTPRFLEGVRIGAVMPVRREGLSFPGSCSVGSYCGSDPGSGEAHDLGCHGCPATVPDSIRCPN